MIHAPEESDARPGEPGAQAPEESAFRTARARACCKTILVGEHAVVYGAGAVAMPVTGLTISVTLTPRAQPRGPERPIHITLGDRTVSEHFADLVEDACRLLELPAFPMTLQGHSHLLIGAGLGSSAALCVGILRGLAGAAGQTLTCERLAELANHLEKRFHGQPSGLDTCVVAWEKLMSYRKGTAPRPVEAIPMKTAGIPEPWPFVLLDSGARASTKAMIQVAAPYFRGVEGDRRIARFDQLSEAVETAMGGGDAEGLTEAMSEAGRRLAEAGVVTPAMAEVEEAAKAAGLEGVKPTGAGGGGCLLGFLGADGDPERRSRILAQLRQTLTDARVHPVEFHP